MTSSKKQKGVQHYPVMAGSEPAPREEQIAGIVQRVWADSNVYHHDVESLLREWLSVEKCVTTEQEFAMLLSKAQGEFERTATLDVYWGVQRLEHVG